MESYRLISLTEFADRCGLNRKTVYRIVKRGEGPPVIKLTPKRWAVRESDLEAWLTERTVKPVAA